MRCDDFGDALLRYAQGALPEDETHHVDAHVSDCETCRSSLAGYRWIAQNLREHADVVEEGHVSVRLLYESIVEPDKLGQDAAYVASHLEACDSCRIETQRIRELTHIELDRPGTLGTRPSFTERLTAWFTTPATAAATAGVILFVAITGYIVTTSRVPRGAAVEWIVGDEAGGARVFDLPVDLITRGIVEESDGLVPELGAGVHVLGMNIDFLDDMGSSYEFVIYDLAGETMFDGVIPEAALDSGHLELVVYTRAFADGGYRIEVIEIESDGFSSTIAESRFQVSK